MPTITTKITPDAIATAAYYLWVNAGQPAGRDQEFWLKAEAELHTNGQPGSAAPIPPARKSTSKNRARALRKTS